MAINTSWGELGGDVVGLGGGALGCGWEVISNWTRELEMEKLEGVVAIFSFVLYRAAWSAKNRDQN